MKILHYADIQAKIRLYNLIPNFKQSLNSIENIITNQQANIVVLAGDIFEYDEPNDEERDLIYNHIINVLKIDSVKEFVIIDGNHDFDKTNQSSKSPISIFQSVIKSLIDVGDADVINKLHYITESKPITSKYNQQLVWLPYCVNDGGIYNKSLYKDFQKQENITYISLFHAILFEYVVESGLPVRNINKLFKREDFITDIILGGDIHENFEYKGFYYPGSVMQQNFGEGSQLKFNKKEIYIPAQSKFVNVYEFNNEVKISEDKLPISNNLHYLTVDLSLPANDELTFPTIVDSIEKHLKHLHQNGELDLVIKFKLSSDYQKFRSQLIKLATPFTRFEIEIKDIKTIDTDKVENSIDLRNADETGSVGKLTKEIVTKLFTDNLNKIDDNTKTFAKVKTEVIDLFKSNLEFIFDVDKSYIINLLNIECVNGFQKLGPNNVNCDFYGLSRIVGTNGYGKTQFYNMFYWLRYGIVYSTLNKREKTNNNMLVFNNKRTDIDNQGVVGTFIINKRKVTIERYVTRTWKKDTLKSMKMSSMKNKFISKTSQELIITIYDVDGTTVKAVAKDDGAETLLDRWFGNIINNLAIINYDKLRDLINQPADNLEKMLLDYIGNDFIKTMIEQFPVHKDKIMDNTPRPSMSDVQIENKLLEVETDYGIINKKVIEKLSTLNELNSKSIEFNSNLQKLNDELTTIGDIPKLITECETAITEYQNIIDKYTIKEKKPLPDKPTATKPEFVTDIDVDKLKADNATDNAILIQYKADVKKKITDGLTIQETKLTDLNNSLLQDIEKHKQHINDVNTKLTNEINSSYYFTEIEKSYNSFVNEKTSLVEYKQKIVNGIDKFNVDIDKLQTQIDTGICQSCGTVLTDVELIEKSKTEIEKLKTNVTTLNSALTNQNTLITNIDTKINNYGNVFNSKLLSQESLNTLNIEDEKMINSLAICESKQKQIDSNLVALENFNKLSFEDKLTHLHEYKEEYRDNIDNYNKTKSTIKLLNDFDVETINKDDKMYHVVEAIESRTKQINDYNEKLVTHNNLLIAYNNVITKYNEDVADVQKYNQSIIDAEKEYTSTITLKNNKTSELHSLKTDKLLTYNDKVKSIQTLTETIENNKQSITEADTYINNNKLKLVGMSKDIEKLKIDAELCQKYNEKKHIIKYYELMIKTILPKAVFNYYRDSVNYKFNELLHDVNFSLDWNSDGNLYKIEYDENGDKIYTVINGASGMETIFLGLSFVYSVTELNHKHNFSHIFIDELSGQLNKGENNNKDMNTNYQELLLLLLNKFNNSKIFIVDHVIKNMYETQTLRLTYDNKTKQTIINN